MPEYALSAEQYSGKEAGRAWVDQTIQMGVKQWIRIAVTPNWVGIIDMVQRFPSAFERAMEGQS